MAAPKPALRTRVSVYDMDRTITRRGTWVPWLVFWLRREAPWRVLLLPLVGIAGVGHIVGLVDRRQLKSLAQRWLMGRRVRVARVAAAAETFVAQLVAHDLFSGAVAQIAADRADGQKLVLATASNAYYAEVIGKYLGFEDIVATPVRIENGCIDWRLGANCYGAEKARRVAQTVGDAELTAYSDHESDMPLFLLAEASGGKAVAANPSAALCALATERGWDIVSWGTVERSLFERA